MPFRVRLRFAGKAWELREPGPDESDGELSLDGAVETSDQRFELVRSEELHFVNEECNACLAFLCGLPEYDPGDPSCHR